MGKYSMQREQVQTPRGDRKHGDFQKLGSPVVWLVVRAQGVGLNNQ